MGKGEAGEDRDLLARAVGKLLEALGGRLTAMEGSRTEEGAVLLDALRSR